MPGEPGTSRSMRSGVPHGAELRGTARGWRSGREMPVPGGFVGGGDGLFLVPARGRAPDWYKNGRKVPTLRLTADGAQITARATPVTDPAKVAEILDKFRAKYGAQEVAAYYSKQDVAVAVPLS